MLIISVRDNEIIDERKTQKQKRPIKKQTKTENNKERQSL